MGNLTGDGDCGDSLADPPAGDPRALDSPVGEGNLVDDLKYLVGRIQNNNGAGLNFNIHQDLK